MFNFSKFDGSEMSRDPKGVKARLAETFRKPGQQLKSGNPETPGIMDEMAKLTDADLADFARWYEEAGYAIQRV